jgi:Thiamine monophosphate synthase
MSRPPVARPACRLYLITPSAIDDLEGFADLLEAALDAGDVAALQIRLKPASDAAIERAVRRLGPIARARGVAVILNDRPDLAAALGCDGVHVGQGDAPVAQARRLMGPQRHDRRDLPDSRHLAMEAAEAGADYVAFGAFFPTATKETTHRPDPDDPDHLAGDHGGALRRHRGSHPGQRRRSGAGGRGLRGRQRGGLEASGRSGRGGSGVRSSADRDRRGSLGNLWFIQGHPSARVTSPCP